MTHPRDPEQTRIDDATRDEARAVLSRHFSAGRLDYAEYDDRVGAASTARTFADLRPLFDDLPPPHPGWFSTPYGSPPAPIWGPPPATIYAPASFPPASPLAAPFGFEPGTGRPYSDKQRVVGGLLQVFLGCFGVGRFYTGHNAIGLAQLLVTVLSLGVAAPITVVWGLVDGILMLTGSVTDSLGRPLR